jgi:hypothetical protein
MKRAKQGCARPYVFRDFEFIREGPHGTVWQAADGMVVRVAAAEWPRRRAREAEAVDTSLPEHGIASGPARAW